MGIRVCLKVDGKAVKEDEIELNEDKLEPLTEEEIQQVIEIKVQEWANRCIEAEWEWIDRRNSQQED